jgi:hypothetical protein
MSAWIRRAGSVVPVVFIIAAAACHGDSVVSPATGPKWEVAVEAVTAVQVEGIVEQPVAQTPTVIVKDLLGHPVAGITVNFSDPTGTVSVPSMVTDPTGIASPGQWIPGPHAGQSTLFIRIDGSVRMRFTATVHPDIPAVLRALSDTDDVEVAGAPVTSLSVLVQDKFGNGIAGVGIAFWLYGQGVVSLPSAVTDSNGVASLSTWTPGPGVGVYALVARADGLDSVMFKARTLDPASLVRYSLESIIAGGMRFPITDEYVDAADLALSPDGYYVEDIVWTVGTGHSGGRYTLSNSNMAITFSKSGETALIAGDSLVIDRRDPDTLNPITWLYRMRKN